MRSFFCKSLSLVFLLLPLSIDLALAQSKSSVDFSKDLPTVSALVEQFRSEFSRKIEELSNSFIRQVEEGSVFFRSNHTVRCGGMDVPEGTILAKITKSISRSSSELHETYTYSSCLDRTSQNLVEMIARKGKDLKESSWEEILQGKRDFELGDQETSYRYSLVNGAFQEVFGLISYREGARKVYDFYLGGSRGFQIQQIQTKQRVEIVFSTFQYQVEYQNERFIYRKLFLRSPINIRAVYYLDGKKEYMDSSGGFVSLGEFKDLIKADIIDPSLKGVLADNIISYHVAQFPETVRATGLTQADRVVNELKLARIRLLNGTDLDQVRLLVEEYLKAIENGLIRVEDSRPEK